MAGARESERLAVVVDDLWETFRLYHEKRPGLKERLYRLRRSNFELFHALKGVSLSIRHGESVGLIGHNGSGKSTLLKCLAGILPPDHGSVTTYGRVSTLLELGAGFHEELSGRENVYMNGALLGLSEKEIDERFDRIVDFAGIRDFIDQPVRNYSSGMYVRLGFAVAVHVEPEILLVDEVLAVGDAAFQEKSLERMRSFNQRGKTVVLVSHDLNSIAGLCERTVVMDHGRVVFDGPTEEAVEAYEDIVASGQPAPAPEPEEPEEGRTGDGRARITDASFDVDGVAEGQPAPTGEKADLALEVTAHDDLVPLGGLTVGINVRRPEVAPCVYETRTAWRTIYLAPPPAGESFRVTFRLDLAVLAGYYVIDLLVGNAESTTIIHDRWIDALSFRIDSPEYEYGVAPLAADITVDNPEGIWPPESLPPPLAEGGPRYHPNRDEPAGDRRS